MADSADKTKPSRGAKILGYTFITVGVFVLLSGGCTFLVLGPLGGPGIAYLAFGAICLGLGAAIVAGKGRGSPPKQDD